jgi:chromate transporter
MDINLQIFWVFFKISLVSIGGVFGTMPELERMIVNQNHWMTIEQFYQAYVIAQFVPGPTMAFCPIIGYMVSGWAGFFAGFIGIYTAPMVMVVVAYKFYSRVKSITWVKKTELSIRPIVVGLISASTVRLWIVQTRFHEQQSLITAITLVMMAATLYAHHKLKWDILILVLAFGGLWTLTLTALNVHN